MLSKGDRVRVGPGTGQVVLVSANQVSLLLGHVEGVPIPEVEDTPEVKLVVIHPEWGRCLMLTLLGEGSYQDELTLVQYKVTSDEG